MEKTLTMRQSWLLRAGFFVLMACMMGTTALGQCLSATYGLYPSSTYTPTCNSTFGSITAAAWAGEYSNVNVIAGNTYSFRSSVSTDFVTIGNAAGTTAFTSGIGGLLGLTWVSPVTGTVRFYTHTNSGCGSLASSRTRSVSCSSGAPAYNPCASQPVINCATTVIASNGNGNGAWDSYGGPFGVPGQELVYKFTPTVSGNHVINVVSMSGGGYVDFFFKDQAFGCNATGWSYIDDFIGAGNSVNFNLTAGTTYYIMLDDENTTATTVTFNITCPTIASYDPCANTPTISACGVSTSSSNAAGQGAWDSYGGPFGVPGQENVFKFTPANSGLYTVDVTSISGSYIDFFFKAQSVGCNATGWTYIDDFIGTGSSTVFALTAGVPYYIMWDDEDQSASSVTFSLSCPAPDPCTNISNVTCGSSSTTTLNGSVSAFNPGGCYSTPGQEQVYSFTAPSTGSYTINVSGSTGTDYFDYYFKAAGAGCGPTGWTCIDDITGSGTSVTFNLTGGTTYLILVDKENFLGNNATMSQTWSIGCPPPPPANDNCANATSFTGNSQPFTTVSASGTDISSCTTGDFNDVWFTWTAPSCGQVTFNTCGSGFDTHLSLWSSCGAGELACNDDFCGLQSSISATVVAGQTYYLRAAGYNGAQGTGTINMSMSAPLTGSVSGSDVSCFGGNNGSASVFVAGGSGSYSYNWSNGGNTATISGLTAGSYNVVVTDGFGCTYAASVTVNEPTALGGSLAAQTYVGGVNVSCNGAADGAIFANISGGTAPYSYAWSNGGTAQMISGLTAGNYSVVVTDANGCTFTAAVTLTEPAPMANTISAATFACGTNVSCNGASDGSINLTVTGGSGNYAFSWSNGATTEDLSGLGAGTYSVTAVDQNGCSTSASITLTEPALLTASLSGSVYACGYGISCNGASDGSLSSVVSGGCAPYSYAWSTGGIGGTINGLSAGMYSVTVTDANGCQAFATGELTQPAPVTVSCSGNATVYYGWGPSACATISASGFGGGCGPYSILWSNGATTASQTVCPSVSTDYTVTVTDANGCTASCTVRVCAIDVRCGNNLQKIEICHNPPGNAQTLCVSPNAVLNHLSHGDHLGACGSNVPCGPNNKFEGTEPAAALDGIEMAAFPNPFQASTTLRFTVPADDNVTLTVFAMDGRKMGSIFEGAVEAGKTYEAEFKAEAAANGIYFAKLTTANGTVTTMKLVLMK
jgi:hypothetical protein